jgi:hypothetical protein
MLSTANAADSPSAHNDRDRIMPGQEADCKELGRNRVHPWGFSGSRALGSTREHQRVQGLILNRNEPILRIYTMKTETGSS